MPDTRSHRRTSAGAPGPAPDAPATGSGAPGPSAGTGSSVQESAATALREARERTHLLTDPAFGEAELTTQHSPLMSPLVWDLAHVGNQEEIWLLREAGGRPALRPELDQLYDAFQNPRADRPALPLLSPEESRSFLHEVRDRSLEVLARTPLTDSPLLQDGFVFGMVAQHEQQHDETMLATHQLRTGRPLLQAPEPPDGTPRVEPEVLVPAGPFTMGTSTEPWALDNERPAHTVQVPAFWLDTTPVTNAAFQHFIEDGGYAEARWWTEEGWAYRQRAGLEAPLFWRRERGTWWRRRFGYQEEVPPDEPVLHVSWYEADAYARWAGRRLPSEAEWEKAARWSPVTGDCTRYPWGDAPPHAELANLGQRHLRPASAGAYPAGAAPCGARQLLGDVWEWTASDFTGYPGFTAFPYREYSEVFFGSDHKVLRGGSFGTAPVACRSTFRNWDFPVRRQIFAGFRTARTAAPDTAQQDASPAVEVQ